MTRRAAAFVTHVRRLWGRLWFVPLLPLAYAVAVAALGPARPETFVIALIVAALGYAGITTQRLLVAISPLVAVGIVFDLLRYAQPFIAARRILGCEIRNLDLVLYGWALHTTLPEFFALHHAPFFDLVFAIPYAIFIYVAFATAACLFFTDLAQMRRYVWSLAIAYLVAAPIWLLMPVAPPWYIEAHGCRIDPSVPSSAAGLVRVDHLLGIHYFEAFYARAPAAFAAFPSMHCAFPAIGLLVAWRTAAPTARVIHVLYTASMFVGSLYLGHHWLVDALAGWLLAALAVGVGSKGLKVFCFFFSKKKTLLF